MKDIELLKEVNFIIGAVDGKTKERVLRLLRYLHLYRWAYNQLKDIIDTPEEGEVKHEMMNKIQEKLSKELKEADDILKRR